MNEILVFKGTKGTTYYHYGEPLDYLKVPYRYVTSESPPSKEELKQCKGALFCGGGDILPSLYTKEKINERVKNIDKSRDLFEIEALSYLLKLDIPILAICRGMQILNVTLGGTLYQDLDEEFPPKGIPKKHQQKDYNIPEWQPTHPVHIEKNSLIYKIIGREKIMVNSTHHQAVKKLGKNLIITGKSPDGVPEIIEMPQRKGFLLAVQFHPEKNWDKYEESLKIFKAFVKAVTSHGEEKLS